MKFIIVFLFMYQGEITNVYIGETKTEQECYATAQQLVPKILPGVQEGVIMCVKRPEVT